MAYGRAKGIPDKKLRTTSPKQEPRRFVSMMSEGLSRPCIPHHAKGARCSQLAIIRMKSVELANAAIEMAMKLGAENKLSAGGVELPDSVLLYIERAPQVNKRLVS